MPNELRPVIYWVRRDLRVADNHALCSAAESGCPVIPVYFSSNWNAHHLWTGAKRQHFLCGCLESFASNLEPLQGKLIIRHQEALHGLRQLIEESGASAVYYQADPDPYGKSTEQKIEHLCHQLDVACHRFDEVALHTPQEVLTQAGLPYRVYTPYSRNWLQLDKAQPCGKPKPLQTPPSIASEPLLSVEHWGLEKPEAALPEPGERAARSRLKLALDGIIQRYADQRDFPAIQGTSRISQDLRFGTLSIRTVYAAARKASASAAPSARKGIDTFIKQLAWREFYFAILHHYPNVLQEEFNADWRGLPWQEPDEKLELWKSGRTGFPIIDAGMRELLATGYMHNRVRMITAMFFTKDLHLDWKLGESFFMQHLIDGEIASNNGGWQWSAGTGADAAPYFRIQNPWSQTARYDPQGVYIKRWVPELATTDAKRFLAPPEDGKAIAPDYTPPCLNHKTERERTLATFKRHRQQQQ